MNKIAGFVGYEEVRLYKDKGYHRYCLYVTSENIVYDSHGDLYIPPAIWNQAPAYILLLLYDYELTRDSPGGTPPTKVLYTDFYFRALSEGILDD